MGRLIGCTCRAGMAGLISMSNLKTSQGALWPGIASVKPYGAECLTGCSARFGVLGSFMLVGHKHAPVSVNEALHKQRWGSSEFLDIHHNIRWICTKALIVVNAKGSVLVNNWRG